VTLMFDSAHENLWMHASSYRIPKDSAQSHTFGHNSISLTWFSTLAANLTFASSLSVLPTLSTTAHEPWQLRLIASRSPRWVKSGNGLEVGFEVACEANIFSSLKAPVRVSREIHSQSSGSLCLLEEARKEAFESPQATR
jgi:hypothetical protein